VRRGLGSLFVAAALLLGVAGPAGAIVYGQPDSSSRYANVGAILVDQGDGPQQWCSGTYIGPMTGGTGLGVFLTAAHCIVPLIQLEIPLTDVRISFDQDLADPGPPFIPVQAVHFDPRFTFAQANPFDIGVLLFDETDAPAGLEPAEIAPIGYLAQLGKAIRRERFTAVGYGTVRQSRARGFQGILANTQRYVARQGFRSLRKAWLTLSMNQATGDGGTCYGDSGGPHFHLATLVSVTVSGDAMCKAIDKTYRLDRAWVHAYLDDFIDLP
jgi:hypothetical protein